MTIIETTATGAPAPRPFVEALTAVLRDDGAGDAPAAPVSERVEGFLLSKEARRAMPIIGDPDPATLRKVELFYRAVAKLVEARTGLVVPLMMKMSHEGFGRVVLTAGKLVVFAKSLRDVHRFGFDGLDALAREGEKAASQALASIAAYPAVARA
jgi:probable nitrogen fixation protein